MDYCDIDYLEEYGYFDNVPEPARAMLTVHISQASDMIDRYCGRKFGIPVGATAETRTYTMLNKMLDPHFRNTLWLDEDLYIVTSIATVDPAVTLTWMPQNPPYYAIIRDGGAWEDPTTITGFWAYAASPPAVIVNETARLAMAIYHQRERPGSDGGIGPYGKAEPDPVVLGPYKRVRLP